MDIMHSNNIVVLVGGNMKSNIRYSIITPTYNRLELLKELAENICNLKYDKKMIEWVIVDDCSTDGTENFVNSLIKNKNGIINILYFKQLKRQGITNSVAKGISLASGKYITRIDSDDLLVEDTFIMRDELLSDVEDNDEICGVVGLCINKNDGKVRGTEFPYKCWTGIAYKYKTKFDLSGDRNYSIKRHILSDVILPEHNDTYYVPESPYWLRIDLKYKTKFVNIPFSITREHADNSYLDAIASKEKKVSTIIGLYYGDCYSILYAKKILTKKDYFKFCVRANYYEHLIKKVKAKYQKIKLPFTSNLMMKLTKFLGIIYYLKKKNKLTVVNDQISKE